MKKLNESLNRDMALANKLLKSSISKDETRLHLSGIYIDDRGYKVSSDGYTLTRTSWGYSPSLNNLIVTPLGNVVDREFPRIDNVIPNRDEYNKITITFKRNQFKALKNLRKKTTVYIVETENGFEVSESSENSIACFNYYYLKELKGDLTCYYRNEMSPLLIDIDMYTDYVVMPIRM